MNLLLHLSIHIALSLLAGFVVWKLWKKPVASFAGGILGGFLIDLDHFIDYLLAFGLSFNIDYFLQGYQFLKSGKIYILFHGWEYVIILLLIAFLLKKRLILKSIFLALAIGVFFHLATDLTINDGTTFRGYSIIYRMTNNFEIEKIVTPEHYKKYLIERENAI